MWFGTAVLETLARTPRVSEATRRAYTGEVSGLAFRGWASLLERRFGIGASDAVRRDAGLSHTELPDAPDKTQWFPVGLQLLVTQAALDRYMGGALPALEEMLVEDALGTMDRVKRRMLAVALRPGPVFTAAPRVYAALYRPGRALATVGRGEATVTWSGAAFHADPLWQALQVVATAGFLRATGRERAVLLAPASPPGAFALNVRW
jgi:hypothetical protein